MPPETMRPERGSWGLVKAPAAMLVRALRLDEWEVTPERDAIRHRATGYVIAREYIERASVLEMLNLLIVNETTASTRRESPWLEPEANAEFTAQQDVTIPAGSIIEVKWFGADARAIPPGSQPGVVINEPVPVPISPRRRRDIVLEETE